MNQRIVIDLETRSEADLRIVGGWEYSKHPSTEIVCFSYKIGSAPTQIFYPIWDQEMPDDLQWALHGGWPSTLVAHNAFFEQALLANCYNKKYEEIEAFKINPLNWKCTAAKCRAHSFPGKLEKAAPALKLPFEKDTDGHKLMLKMCKPRKSWKPGRENEMNKKQEYPYRKYHDTEAEVLRLGQYCIRDTEVEYAIDIKLPDLSPYETKVWELDQKINMRGMRSDVATCKTILSMIEIEATQLQEEVTELTLGIVRNATQRNELLEFVQTEGLDIPDLRAKTIETSLEQKEMSDVARRLLEIRKTVSKTSTAKYKRFIQRAGEDQRVRDTLVYHGPSTGRWSGSGGIQPQNFPRGSINDIDLAIDIIQSGDLELVRLAYGDPMIVFSSVLRGMIVASEGNLLFGTDLNAIETRVVWWLADNQSGLDLFRSGIDPYLDQAEIVYKRELTKADKIERQLGKKVILACGFGMGPPKFMQSCHLETGLEWVDKETSETAVYAYRKRHYKVVELWGLLEQAALYAVKNPTKSVKVSKVKFYMDGFLLKCELPSGRCLSYPYPTIEFKDTPWGVPKPTLHYWGMNSFSRKWTQESTYGGKLAENVTQAVARDVMVHGMFNVEEAGYELVLTVHDELVPEKDELIGSAKEVEKLMTTMPAWCLDLPVKAEGWGKWRYRK